VTFILSAYTDLGPIDQDDLRAALRQLLFEGNLQRRFPPDTLAYDRVLSSQEAVRQLLDCFQCQLMMDTELEVLYWEPLEELDEVTRIHGFYDLMLLILLREQAELQRQQHGFPRAEITSTLLFEACQSEAARHKRDLSRSRFYELLRSFKKHKFIDYSGDLRQGDTVISTLPLLPAILTLTRLTKLADSLEKGLSEARNDD
jgi:hypothetical protein